MLSAGSIWVLAGLERRWKRARALQDLYRLRAFAHVIDMYQLTKDPSVVLAGARPTASSPRRIMSEPQLLRYLDYCSELLALISKLAALYAAHSRDSEVISAVNDIEELTSNLGRKIWQKITILSQLRDADDPPALDGSRARSAPRVRHADRRPCYLSSWMKGVPPDVTWGSLPSHFSMARRRSTSGLARNVAPCSWMALASPSAAAMRCCASAWMVAT